MIKDNEKNREKACKNAGNKRNTLKNIQKLFFRSQMILIVTLSMFLGIAGILINIHFETKKRDQNLQNVAETIARSPILATNRKNKEESSVVLSEYLDSLKETLDDIDVISVVGRDNVRLYHSNHALIGTVYDGNLPKFDDKSKRYYTTDETGPSGMQRRAYAAIYDENGQYMGVVMAIMLMENIHSETYQTFWIFALITIAALVIELFISAGLFEKIKMSLLGYEPDTFTAMYKIRDNILESLAEGILAIGGDRTIQFANEAAVKMLETAEAFTGDNIVGQKINDISNGEIFVHALESGEKEYNRNFGNTDILIDSIPIKEEDKIVGAVGILHNRAEYTKLMEDLTGTRYLVDSMRANNHDFTNKLHVILGLIQMGMYEEATSYIQNITMVQREIISKIMNAVNDPAVAALLIGKTARAAELDIKFILREGCCYSPLDMNLPSEILVTVIGNLLDNAFDAMNEKKEYDDPKELLFGIYSRPGAVLITVDDTGNGMKEQGMEHIFEKGYSTKGEGRGTGLYQVKTMVEEHGGKITVESQEGIGTSFSVSFMGKRI